MYLCPQGVRDTNQKPHDAEDRLILRTMDTQKGMNNPVFV